MVCFVNAHCHRVFHELVDPFIEVGDGDPERLGNLEQASRRDSVDAFFVFLDLLEGQTELLAKLFLSQFQFATTPA